LTAFWYAILALGTLAAIINFSLGWAHRARPVHALVRFAAGVVSLVPPIGILVSKLMLHLHLPLALQGPNEYQYIFIATGLFIGGTLMLPAYVERSGDHSPGVSLQQRAARPANATIRLQKNTDEWVN
jgi:hypothetical protein